MTEEWLHKANAPLARELLRAHRGERAPEAARVDALRVARVALAGSSAISVVAASSKASAQAATSTGGVSGGAVASSAAASSAVVGSAVAGSAVAGSAVAGSAVVGSAVAGSVIVGSASLPAPMLTAGALTTGSGLGGAGTAASAAAGGWIASLGALGAFKLSVSALALVGAGYLGAGAVDHWFPKAEPSADWRAVTAATHAGSVLPVEAAGASGTHAAASADHATPETAAPGEGGEGTVALSRLQGEVRRGADRSPRSGALLGAVRPSSAPAREDSRASAVTRGAQPGAAPTRLPTDSAAKAGSKTTAPSGGRERQASQPASAGAVDAASSRHLADELGLIRRAHEALRAGDSAAARRWLERYERRFPSGKLRPEASQLKRRLASARTR